ncbi:MAG: CinA family nicotinamide mononucleotide deamidase-related protein, partial [Deltaproteobacteria bacterium]|nr:CinA family nicotinamide mononucleotide deamidase-related protein [Deltaproteobacteria bacterium]
GNAAWIASEIHARGQSVSRISVVGDDLERLESELAEAFGEHDLVLVGGGLGPTDDDLTAQAAARATGVDLVRDEAAEAQVRAAFDRLGREMNPVNLKQADLPAGCRVLANPVGTAPGFAIDTPKGRALFFPGVPFELEQMFETYIPDELPAEPPGRNTAVLKCFGIGESDVQAALAPLVANEAGVRLAFRASFPEIRVSIIGNERENLERLSTAARQALGRAVYATEDISLPAALGRALRSAGLTIATAESCTGGLVGHSLTEVPGSSAYYRGGVVAYDNDVKITALGIGRDLIEAHGAVSQEVASAMASGVRQKLDSDLALATSGIAGPDGGTAEKPVGLVFVAIAHKGGVDSRRHVFKGFSRSRVKQASAWWAMRKALDTVAEPR